MTDIKTTPKTETERLFSDLSKPSLHVLSYALRHPDTWPEGFIWNYNKCDQCAMGLAHQLWSSIPATTPSTGASIMAREFAMPFTAAQNIFLAEGGWMPKRTREVTSGRLFWKKTVQVPSGYESAKAVTPEMVADQIDAYLETAE